MIKKVFLITEFGSPFSWTDKYIENIGKLKDTGWYWKIFTPNKYENLPENVEIIDMTAEQFAELVEKKLGVKPNIFITTQGVPSVHVTDFYVASGIIFEDYLKDFDFWGITNMDMVYGRLSRFVPDEVLKESDIFTDDVATINGIFSLYKNTEKVNNLFKEIPYWKEKFTQEPCKKCLGEGGEHTLAGTDEYDMTNLARKASMEKRINMLFPQYYFLHSHDRLENHVPNIKLIIKEDNSLWELYQDLGSPNWIHKRPQIGREIMMFHFSRTKCWPECLHIV